MFAPFICWPSILFAGRRMSGPPGVLAGQIAGRYIFEREIGRGATAVVYLARTRSATGRSRSRSWRRARAVGRVTWIPPRDPRHSGCNTHASPVLDSGEHDGQLYFVLPTWREGRCASACRAEAASDGDATAIALTVAEGVARRAQPRLIHRDVSRRTSSSLLVRPTSPTSESPARSKSRSRTRRRRAESCAAPWPT